MLLSFPPFKTKSDRGEDHRDLFGGEAKSQSTPTCSCRSKRLQMPLECADGMLLLEVNRIDTETMKRDLVQRSSIVKIIELLILLCYTHYFTS